MFKCWAESKAYTDKIAMKFSSFLSTMPSSDFDYPTTGRIHDPAERLRSVGLE